MKVKQRKFYYGENHALRDISLSMKENTVTALIGPSGCGKSTYLRLLNRMNDLIDGTKMSIVIDGTIFTEKKTPMWIIRKNVGMVFKTKSFSKTILKCSLWIAS
jgi:phosphate transport system ATP-binding protein